MFDFSQLKAVKSKTEQRDSERSDQACHYLAAALLLLEEFSKTKNNQLLKEAADKLVKSLASKRSQPEPYIYLSCIFHMLDEDRLAIKYFQAAAAIDSQHPLLKKLKLFIV